GPVGLGTAAAVQERGGMLIGVDTDWVVSAPEYEDIVLTSVRKNMDVAVYTAIESAMKGTFEGGVYVGTLANDGVGLAPFHAFDADMPAELKAELEEIKQDLIDGVIWTGWGEEPAPKVTGEPVKLTFWHTQEPEAFRGKLLDGMIEDFQKEYPWITIESSYQGSYTDLYRKMMATIAAGEMPDFAVAYPSQISEYMQADAVVPLDAYINDPEIGLTEGDMKDIFPGFLAECRFPEFDNQYLAFPFTKSYVGMWYNMDLLKAAGWDHVPTTWAEFEQACNDVSDKTDARGYAFYESASTFDAWLFSRGAEQLNADQTEAVFNGPEGVESLEMMLRLIETGGAWKPEGSYADQAEFGQGNAAFTMSSTSGTYYYRKAVEESGTGPEEWGQTMIPQSDPSNPKTVMYGASICVFKTTEAKQRAAWLFIRYFSDTAQTALWGSKSGYIPVRASAAALLDEYFAGEPIAKEQFEKIVPYGKPEPSVRGEQEIRDFLYDAMVAAFSEVATPQEALDEAVELANEALARGRE
ncbi:MAG: extracellular solute-binding protein, partial [Chloroflexota bacterium]